MSYKRGSGIVGSPRNILEETRFLVLLEIRNDKLLRLFSSALSLKISVKIVLRIMFALWVVAVTALSVLSYSVSNDLLVSVKVTSSGFVMHGVAYFVGTLLCFLAFDAKNVPFAVWTGLLIFLYSVALEVIQFYLPYRTFNVYDVVANVSGILGFVVVWILFISHRRTPVPSAGATPVPSAGATGQAGQARTDTDFCPADPG